MVLVLLAVACEGDAGEDGAAGGGSIARDYDLTGRSFTVGSKEFTEQLVLGQITIAALRAAGAKVADQTGLASSSVARTALISGSIDMYWEYTGTGRITHLGETRAIPDSARQYEAVAEEDLAEHRIVWMPYAPYVNSYAVATSVSNSRALGVTSISDLGELVERSPGDATFCGGNEFVSRDDGLPGLEGRYGFSIPSGNVSLVQDSVVYRRVGTGDPCKFASVFSTDARIGAEKLVVLEDDKSFFPKYNPALNVRESVATANPRLRPLAAALARALDAKTIAALNAQVDIDGQQPEDVASEWLREKGFISG